MLASLATVSKEHDGEFTAALDSKQRAGLRSALETIVADQGLTPGACTPGFGGFLSVQSGKSVIVPPALRS